MNINQFPHKVALLALPVLISGPALFAQGITIGAPATVGAGNIFPFGTTVPAYQQVYAASDFSGPITIDGLTFFNSYYGPGSVFAATYTIELSTTHASVNGLSITFADNLGPDNTTVFSGTLSGAANSSFTIPTSLFTYQPADGNLLLTVYQSNPTGNNPTVGFDERQGTAAGLFSRMYSFSSTTTGTATSGDNDYGLVTEFDTTPEPQVAALMGLGGMSAWLIRRRRT